MNIFDDFNILQNIIHYLYCLYVFSLSITGLLRLYLPHAIHDFVGCSNLLNFWVFLLLIVFYDLEISVYSSRATLISFIFLVGDLLLASASFFSFLSRSLSYLSNNFWRFVDESPKLLEISLLD